MADEFVNVLATSSVVEGELARGRLESEGIPVLLKGEGIDAPYPTGPVYLFVPAPFETRARQLLDEAKLARTRTRLTTQSPGTGCRLIASRRLTG
jgi:hypothetical protein